MSSQHPKASAAVHQSQNQCDPDSLLWSRVTDHDVGSQHPPSLGPQAASCQRKPRAATCQTGDLGVASRPV